MCGLVGVAGDIKKVDVDIFNQLLFADTLRGQDSTGVASIDILGNVDWIKRVGVASDLQDLRNYDTVVCTRKKVIIGHNRYGTQGAKSNANAHPFEHGTIVGAHNGTVPYDAKLKLPDASTFGTDSEAIINSINKQGIEATLSVLHGAWALTYYDSGNETLNFIRNKERPLYYCFNKDETVLYWASEIGMLQWIIGRNNVEIGTTYMLAVDTLLSFSIPDAAGLPFDEPTRQTILGAPPKPPVVVNNYATGRFPSTTFSKGGRYIGGVWWPDKSRERDDPPWDNNLWEIGDNETLKDYFDRTDEALGGQLANLQAVTSVTYKHPLTNAIMTKEEFDEITQYGCDWCASDIIWGTHASFIVNSNNEPECFCEDCTLNNNEAKLYIRS